MVWRRIFFQRILQRKWSTNFIQMNDLNKAYKELYYMVLEKATFGYEIDDEVLKTLDELKGEVEIHNSPFLVRKKVKCSICGKEITRNKNFPKVVCFNCKVERQRIYNSKYKSSKPAVPERSS